MKKLLFTTCILISGWVSAQSNLTTYSFGSVAIESNLVTKVNANDEIFMGGLFGFDFEFDNELINHKGGNADAYFLKFNADGSPAWMKAFGGWADDALSAFTFDDEGNSYLTGYFQGRGTETKLAFDADPSFGGEFLLQQPGSILTRDCFIIKLDVNGDFVWAKQISNYEYAANEDSFDIAVDADGNVIVVGRYAYADFDPSPTDTLNILSASGKLEGFVLKLTNDGDFMWVKNFYGNEISVREVEIDTDGNIIVAGDFKGTVNLDSNTVMVNPSKRDYNMYVAKLNPDGDLLASQYFGGDAKVNITAMDLTSNNDIILAGRITGICELNPTDSSDTYTTRGALDMFLNTFDKDLNYKKTLHIGGPGSEEISSITEDVDGSILLSASFTDSIVVSTDNDDVVAKSSNGTDVLLITLDADGNYKDHLSFGGNGNIVNPFMRMQSNGDLVLSSTFTSNVNANPYGESDTLQTNGLHDVYMIRFNWASVVASVEGFGDVSSLNIYPNPATNVVNIDGIEAKSYEVYTIQGTMISSGAINASNVDVSGLTTGNYILSVTDANGMRYPIQFSKQ